jgi:hypothetical protein
LKACVATQQGTTFVQLLLLLLVLLLLLITVMLQTLFTQGLLAYRLFV